MSRRFSDEPINLIHRIPTPEQLSAARPSRRSFGSVIIDSAAAWVRGMVRRVTGPTANARTAGWDHVDPVPHLAGEDSLAERQHVSGAERLPQAEAPIAAAGSPTGDQAGIVQPEEVAELRAYILTQQQDIARLSAQLQELKSLVISQQQVLAYLGKELEAAPDTRTGVASAPAKRSRAMREKPLVKDQAVRGKDPQNPSLSL